MSSSIRRRAVAPDNADDDEGASDTLSSSSRLLTRASCRHCQRGPPPGRMLGYAAVIHLLQLALEMCRAHTHTRAHLDCGAHTHTSWISCCQEQQRGQAPSAQSRCTRQEERKEKRDSERVLFCRQLRNTHRCLNPPSSHEHNGEITLQTAR